MALIWLLSHGPIPLSPFPAPLFLSLSGCTKWRKYLTGRQQINYCLCKPRTIPPHYLHVFFSLVDIIFSSLMDTNRETPLDQENQTRWTVQSEEEEEDHILQIIYIYIYSRWRYSPIDVNQCIEKKLVRKCIYSFIQTQGWILRRNRLFDIDVDNVIEEILNAQKGSAMSLNSNLSNVNTNTMKWFESVFLVSLHLSSVFWR